MLLLSLLAALNSPLSCACETQLSDEPHPPSRFDYDASSTLECDVAVPVRCQEPRVEPEPTSEFTSTVDNITPIEAGRSVEPELTVKPTPQSNDQIADQFVSDFLSYLESEVAPHTPGYALAIILNGRIAYLGGLGEKRVGSGQAINKNTVFRLASVSKTFASAAVGKLIEDNQLSWETKITRYSKDVSFSNPEYASELTLQHILSHTTGLIPHAYTNLIEEPLPFDKIVKKLNQVPFVCEPGDCYGYQNVTYSLVSDLFPQVNKQSFEEYVQREILTPLQMSDAHYGYRPYLKDDNRVTPHVWSRRNKKWVPVGIRKNYYKVAPAAGLNASISDMAQWLRAQMGHYPEVLSKETLSAMHSKVVRTSRRQAHYRGQRWRGLQKVYYGLGWRVFDYRDQKDFVHHGGFVRGHRASVVFNRDKQMGLAFLTNSETGKAKEVVPAFVSRYVSTFASPALVRPSAPKAEEAQALIVKVPAEKNADAR